jgi:phenylalanyl-tRNA synthetase beta chain
MKVPLSWLQEFLPITQNPRELANILTLTGLEVEAIESLEKDAIFDITLTPNLGHCMSVFGIARELSALLDLPLKKKEIILSESQDPIETRIQVTIYDRKKCLRYAARVILGIEIRPSPQWIQERLEACGMRSINNLVDIGTLVLLEWGQPLHMFDYDAIAEHRILVTSETNYPSMETLDGVSRLIPPESLLICDPLKPLAFAGVIGGKNSMVTGQTQNILIEAAYFTPQAVRKSSKLLGCHTDASNQFDKGTDPNGIDYALDYAAMLVQKCAGGHIVKGMIDQKVHEFPAKRIPLRIARTNHLLGTHLSLGDIETMLNRMQFATEGSEKEVIASVPAYRHDIAIEEDLIEEVAKLYGYNQIPQNPPRYRGSTIPHAPTHVYENQVRTHLAREGLQEWMTCDLISPEQVALVLEPSFAQDNLISVMHARSVDYSVLRPSLLPGMLTCAKYNYDRDIDHVAAFEIGKIHRREQEQWIESSTAAILLFGAKTPYHWDPVPEETDFFDLKGIIENLLRRFHVEVEFSFSHLHAFHPKRQARLQKKSAFLGALGELHPALLAKWGFEKRIFFAELNLHELHAQMPKDWKLQNVPLFPASDRDLTITIKEEKTIAQLFDTVHTHASPLLEQVFLLNLYKSPKIGKNMKNVTFRFRYRDRTKTIDFETVEREHAHITRALMQQLD